ncbi:MAG: hypothetical protein P1V20_23220 [Verrucomicrobiales bacterium]|nr:hypothetical protein [Verrucomicrobiales bacterium]
MIPVETYRDAGLVHNDVIVRVTSQNFVASREKATPDATAKIQEAIGIHGWEKAFPEQIYAPYFHDEDTLKWLVEQFDKFPKPADKVQRIFAERQLRWPIYSTPEVAEKFYREIEATTLAKSVASYSSRVEDLEFNASLAGLSRDECWAQMEDLLEEQHDLELPMTFELDKTECLARHLATLGGVDKDLMEKWLDFRPEFDAMEPEMEEIQVETAMLLLAHDPSINVDVSKLFHWINEDLGDISDFAFRALRARQTEDLTKYVIAEFPGLPETLRLHLCNFLESSSFPALREDIWKLYENEADFEVLGALAEVLGVYGGEDFEKAALEVLELGGVGNEESLLLTIYTNRVLAGQKFKEKKEWERHLSNFYSADFIQTNLSYEIDPDMDKDLEDIDPDFF